MDNTNLEWTNQQASTTWAPRNDQFGNLVNPTAADWAAMSPSDKQRFNDTIVALAGQSAVANLSAADAGRYGLGVDQNGYVYGSSPGIKASFTGYRLPDNPYVRAALQGANLPQFVQDYYQSFGKSATVDPNVSAQQVAGTYNPNPPDAGTPAGSGTPPGAAPQGGGIQPPTGNLMPGMSGPEVAKLQSWLISKGYQIADGATGFFGNQTKAALTKYQSDNQINTQNNPGFYGPITREFIAKQGGNTAGGPAILGANTSNTGTAGTTGTINPGSAPGTNSQGQYSLVKFTSDPNGSAPGDQTTTWLVDNQSKVMRPIMNDQAFKDLYGDQYMSALQHVTTVDPSAIMQGGNLSGYTLLDAQYGVYEKGQARPLDFSPSAIRGTYGQTVNPDTNAKAAQTIDGWLSMLKQNLSTSGLSQATIDSVLNDKVVLAGYISALAYGGYTPMDIYMDIKRRDMIASGDTSASDLRVIDANLKKQDYLNTSQGQTAYNKLSVQVPGRIGSLDRAIFSSVLSQLPDSFYQATFPEMNPDSPEYQAKMDQVKSTLHDAILASITAKTDAQKQAADFLWQNTKEQVEKSYGIKLSDNALEAWNQVLSMESQYSNAGLTGSGIESESLDKGLAAARLQGDRTRDQKTQDMLGKSIDYYTKSASPAEIKALNDEDAAKGLPRSQWRTVQWGLSPLQETTASAFLADFHSRYPTNTMSDANLKAKFYDPYYDENGNFRSTLYKQQAVDAFKTIWGYDPYAAPTTSLKQEQRDKVDAQNLDTINKGEAWKTAADYTLNAPQNIIGQVNMPPELTSQPKTNNTNIQTPIYDTGLSTQPTAPVAQPAGTGTGSTVTPTSPTATKSSYTVKAGDTLSGISKQLFGDATQWSKFGYTGDPTKLQIGTILNY